MFRDLRTTWQRVLDLTKGDVHSMNTMPAPTFRSGPTGRQVGQSATTARR